MIFLFLQALFGSLFGLCLKWVGNRNQQGKHADIFVIGAINYIVAAIAIAPSFFTNEVGSLSSGAMWTGGAMGVIYFIAFFFVLYSIRWVGVSATTVVGVLSIMMPIIFAAFYWDQKPNLYQVVGIGLALLALSLIGGKSGGDQNVKRPWFTPWVLLSFFLLCGLSRISQEAFKHISVPEQKPTFLMTAFVLASIPSFVLLFYLLGYKRNKLTLSEVLFGTGLGLTNIMQSFFILKCFEYFPGYIVFPVTSAGGVLITTSAAVWILNEKLNTRSYIGIGIAVVALFLLNWAGG